MKDYIVQINNQEFYSLEGLPYITQLLYVYLARHMDDQSLTVGGDSYRISYQALSEWLYIEPKQGRKGSGSPSVQELRTAINNLEKAGLIIRQSISTPNNRQLILNMPYRGQGHQSVNKVNTFATRKQITYQTCNKHQENPITTGDPGDLENELGEDLNNGKPPKVNTPQYINKKNNKYINPSKIDPEFFPSDQTVSKAKAMELDNVIDLIEIQGFINYHSVRDTMESDWNGKYLGWLINGKKRKQQQASNSRRNDYASNQYSERPLSEVDKVRAAYGRLRNTKVIEHE